MSNEDVLIDTVAIREIIEKRKQSLIREAEQIVGAYWSWVEESNEGLRQDKKVGERLDERLINVGPRLEKRPSGKYTKYIPNWVYYPYNPRRSSSPKAARLGVRIKPTSNNEFKLSTLLKYTSVADREKIVATEKQILPIREQLEMYHKIIVDIDRREKRLTRITEANREELNND